MTKESQKIGCPIHAQLHRACVGIRASANRFRSSLHLRFSTVPGIPPAHRKERDVRGTRLWFPLCLVAGGGLCRNCRSCGCEDAEGHAWEAEGAASVVDHVDLADVGAGFEAAEGDVELEAHGTSLRNVDRSACDQRRLVDLASSAQELDGG